MLKEILKNLRICFSLRKELEQLKSNQNKRVILGSIVCVTLSIFTSFSFFPTNDLFLSLFFPISFSAIFGACSIFYYDSYHYLFNVEFKKTFKEKHKKKSIECFVYILTYVIVSCCVFFYFSHCTSTHT